jgi:hypothetical protein
MIPLRGVLERLGAERIDWRPADQEVVVSAAGREMHLHISRVFLTAATACASPSAIPRA